MPLLFTTFTIFLTQKIIIAILQYLYVYAIYLEIETIRDWNCWAEFSKTEALSFLSNGKRSTPKECCDENACEQRGVQCNVRYLKITIFLHTKQ